MRRAGQFGLDRRRRGLTSAAEKCGLVRRGAGGGISGGNDVKNRRRFLDLSGVNRQQQTLIMACILFWSVLFYFAVTHFVIQSSSVEGDSMEPTLETGDRYFIHRWLYFVRAPQRGELVAIELPRLEGLPVKRIVALPNERVRIRNGRVYVNHRPLREPYLPDGTYTSGGPLGDALYVVEDGTYFVLGDNRDESLDSRHFGAVRRDDLMGRIDFTQPPPGMGLGKKRKR